MSWSSTSVKSLFGIVDNQDFPMGRLSQGSPKQAKGEVSLVILFRDWVVHVNTQASNLKTK